ncbi:AbrB family transcriptional regulator [Neorhizobium sp. NCHU2750]|uniref:AbrB family transcriptional regulator n=1 Tax=Neorhizobium sp. NCHU2750 TaxID=1825976 RepID=UPI000EB73BB8|nr:ammonia monooxygenase [Neorhizobium sp. NCHU2750]
MADQLMSDEQETRAGWQDRLAALPATVRWVILAIGSLILGWLLELMNLPAALLLGPMAMAIIMALSGMSFRLPKVTFSAAQSVIGVMIASNMPPSIFSELAHQWYIFVLGILATAFAALVLGVMMVKARVFPGTTAIWGSSPGAASVMVQMSESYGGDMRLVAFMQYIRVVCCALVATVVARLFGVTPAAAEAIDWFPALSVFQVLLTLAVAFASAWVFMQIRLPGAPLLGPIAACLALKLLFGMPLVLPPWLLALSYALIGWSIGGRFTRQVVSYAARNFFRVLASVIGLIAISGVFAVILALATGVDPLTAYLATSPGGADSVAIIAASTNVDVPFVMAMQIGRFLFVVLTGPATARTVAKRMLGHEARPAEQGS